MEHAQSFHCYAPEQARIEAAFVRQRLAAAAQPANSPSDVDEAAAYKAVSGARGIALSGGGIRSATFNLGLLQALAQNGRLKEFDFLSTVSGGGYIGSFLGRLYQRAAEASPAAAPVELATEVETVLARDGSPFVRWLRDNGRYLAPRGLKDDLFALGIYCRNFLTIHVLLGVTLLALFLGWAALRLWLSAAVPGPGNAFSLGYAPDGSSWSPAWIGVLVFAALALAVAWAYWMRRKAVSMGLEQQIIALLIVVLAALTLSGQLPEYINDITGRLPPPLIFAALIVSGGAIAAGLLVGAGLKGDLAAIRNRMSSWMRIALAGLGAFALFALVDDGAYHAFLYFGKTASSRNALIGAGIMGALLAGLRAFAQAFAARREARRGKKSGPWLALLIKVAGIALLALVAFGWAFVAVAYAMNAGPGGADIWPVAVAAGLLGTLVLLAGRHLDVLNLSSLHTFYAARLTRAYLGPGNAARGLPWSEGPAHAATLAPVSKVVAGDDVVWTGYAPHLNGGPLHLVNVNVNQTRYSAGGDFQPDRKGWNLALGPAGFNLGRSRWQPAGWANADALGLGQWMAISGAAFTTGAGPRTGLAFSALLGLLGIRLGYWWRAGDDKVPKAQPHMLRALWQEITGAFNPDRTTHWYLSDGGHFENTAAYELIRRRVKRIVVADCGADAKYEFADLSALVLKARIDFGAEIKFLGKDDLDAVWGKPEIRSLFTEPEAIRDRNGPGLLLALVTYPCDPVPGWMVVVKPRLPAMLPADLAHYAEYEEDFPQQSTLDQFYDEAQWESAHKLGRLLGEDLVQALGALPSPRPEDAAPARFKGAAWLGKPAAPAATAGSSDPTSLVKIYAPIVIALWTGFQFYTNWQQEQAKNAAESTKFALSRIDVLERQVFGKEGCAASPRPLAECPTVPAQTLLVRGLLGDLPGRTAQTLKEITDKIDDAMKIGKPPAAVTVAAAIESVAAAKEAPPTQPKIAALTPPRAAPDLSPALVYVQIYSEESRAEATRAIARLQLAGLKSDQLPGVENVSRTAQATAAKSPARFFRPTVIYYYEEDKPLAEWIAQHALADEKQAVDLRDLSRRYANVRKGLVELWLP